MVIKFLRLMRTKREEVSLVLTCGTRFKLFVQEKTKTMGEFSREIIEKATKQTVITGDDMTGSSKSNEKELVD